MGSGKHLMISATGFPGTNQTWRFIQQAWREPLEALAKMAGDKTILTGVEMLSGQITNGYVSYNGEILPFVGGTPEASVTLIEQVVNVTYDVDLDGDASLDSLPGYKTRFLKFGTDGISTFPFTDLKRLKTIDELSQFALPPGIVIDANYVHTDNNFTLALLQKLNSLDQADWNVTNPASGAFIKNKPTKLISYLYKGVAILGDFPQAQTQSTYIYFPSVGTSNYIVLGTIHSFRPEGNAAQDLICWFTAGHEPARFRFGAYEPFGGSQNIRFEYFIIPQ